MIIGLDEAGRGPWAGPIVAAAVALTAEPPKGVRDSKKVPEKERETLANLIRQSVPYGIGEVSAEEIDTHGLGWANRVVFLRALDDLRQKSPELVIESLRIDGNPIRHPDFTPRVPFVCITQGESKHPEIACASLLAKTHRDSLLKTLDELHPKYGFANHKGYGTQLHQKALREFGPIPKVHRMSVAPIKALLSPTQGTLPL